MQSMQPFFDVDFHHYAVDRAALSTSRTRAQLMSVFERKLRQATIDALSRDLAMGNDVEVRPAQAKVDKNGLSVCPCGGRHYVNTDAGWERHITYKRHVCVCLFDFFATPHHVPGNGERRSGVLLLKLRWHRVLSAPRMSTSGSIKIQRGC